MNEVAEILARRYAKALLNSSSDAFSREVVVRCRELADYLFDRSRALYFLHIGCIRARIKCDLLIRLLKRFSLDAVMAPLISLLALHKRTVLLPLILRAVEREYMIRTNSAVCQIFSACALLPDQQVAVVTFLQEKTGKKLEPIFLVDRNLIAGIRAIGRWFLWERSISKQLSLIRSAR